VLVPQGFHFRRVPAALDARPILHATLRRRLSLGHPRCGFGVCRADEVLSFLPLSSLPLGLLTQRVLKLPALVGESGLEPLALLAVKALQLQQVQGHQRVRLTRHTDTPRS
jgi:hypothetical protein